MTRVELKLEGYKNKNNVISSNKKKKVKMKIKLTKDVQRIRDL